MHPLGSAIKGARWLPVDYPGHGRRITEPLERTTQGMADSVLSIAKPIAQSDEYVLFGHSLGATVAWRVARALQDAALRAPKALVVAGAAGPNVPMPRSLANLPLPDLIAELRKMGASNLSALDEPEMRDLVLPMLRADLEATEEGPPSPLVPLRDVPMLALYGVGDADVGRKEVADWATCTTAAMRIEALEGGHFFPFDESIARVAALLEACFR